MKKNILYVNPGPIYRPHSRLFQDQFMELSKNFRGYIFTTSSKEEMFSIADFIYHSVKSDNSTFAILKFYSFCIWNALKLLARRERIDLVTTYDPLKTGLIGVVVSRILRAKFAPEVKGVYTSPAEWVDNPNALSTKLKKRIYPVVMRFVFRHADGIRLLFKGQIDPFKEVIRGKIIHDFHSFVPVEGFRNIKEDMEILFVGFPFRRKGVDILIQGFKKIASLYPEWKLKILGWFPNSEELDKEINGHPQIYRHKPVSHEEMGAHIGSCAVFVLPSRSEAMGRVLVEAMAAGKPRIGSRVDGIPTVINDGVDGLLFEPENVDDLADKLSILMSNPDLRKKLGEAGEARAQEEFSKEEYCRNLSTFYNEILEK